MKENEEIIRDLKKLANRYGYVLIHKKSGNPIKSSQINQVFKPRTKKFGKLLRLTIEKFIRKHSGYYRIRFAESRAARIPAYLSLDTKFNQLKPDKTVYADGEYTDMLNIVDGWLEENQGLR